MATGDQRIVARGDTIEVSGRRVGDSPRLGEILDVLGEPTHPHYSVRWEDGHESILYPGEATHVLPGAGRIDPSLELSGATRALIETMHAAHIQFELLPHRRSMTAAGEARALGVMPQRVAKTIVAKDEEGRYVRAVVPATDRLDLRKLEEELDADGMMLLTEAELVAAYPQFELGAVPPFGGPAGDRVVVDQSLMDADNIVLDAGVHDTSLRLDPKALVDLASAQVCRITKA